MNYFACWVCWYACVTQGQDLVLWELCLSRSVNTRYYTSTVQYSCGKILSICELPCPNILSSIDPRLVRHLRDVKLYFTNLYPHCNFLYWMYRAILHPVIQYSWAEWRLLVPYWMCNAVYCTVLSYQWLSTYDRRLNEGIHVWFRCI